MAVTIRYSLLFLCVALSSILQFNFYLSASGRLHQWFPTVFTLLTAETMNIYTLDFGPWLKVIAFSLFETFVHINAAFLYLLKYEKEFEVFSSGNYVYMLVRLVLASPWTFANCMQKMVYCSLILGVMFLMTCYSFVISLRRRKRMDNENVTESAKFWFDRCVLDAHATWYVWYAHSVSFWGTIAVVYKDGPDLVERGWFSVEDAGTICITFFATAVIGWIVSDLFLFHYYTKHVKAIYPSLIFVSIGVVSRSVSITGEGMNRNNGIYLILGILSAVAWMTRGTTPQTKSEKAGKME